ncbi:DUF4381 domain-containing protein [bacterium]|nr:DUF4381 domain-containing protein [bacterium]
MSPTSLQNLHDIATPTPVAWLPPAPGWYALGFSLLLLLVWFLLKRYTFWQRNWYRRKALIELDQLEKRLTDTARNKQVLPQLAELVKRTALVAYGRNQVASLNGADWLAFLDKTGSTNLFTKGNGRLLADCSYQPDTWFATLSPKQLSGLYKAVQLWIKKHQQKLTNHNSQTTN